MKAIFAAAFAMAAIGFGPSAASAAPAGQLKLVAPSSVVEKVQSERTCRRLRRDCMLKDERGERGEGNCRRYRRACERWWR